MLSGTNGMLLGKGIGVFSKNFIKKDAYPEGDHYVQAIGKGESWNHSCSANMWCTADDELSASRDILPGEELPYDYATTDIDPNINYEWQCRCGSPECRKQLRWNDILNPELVI